MFDVIVAWELFKGSEVSGGVLKLNEASLLRLWCNLTSWYLLHNRPLLTNTVLPELPDLNSKLLIGGGRSRPIISRQLNGPFVHFKPKKGNKLKSFFPPSAQSSNSFLSCLDFKHINYNFCPFTSNKPQFCLLSCCCCCIMCKLPTGNWTSVDSWPKTGAVIRNSIFMLRNSSWERCSCNSSRETLYNS